MITRRGVLVAGIIGLLIANSKVDGRPVARIRRVGWLSLATEKNVAHVISAFKHGMHDLGWVEAKNIEYRFGFADGVADHLAALAAKLIEEKVDLFIVASQPAARAAQRATKTIPIVIVGVGDPVGQGYVNSLARPGGNITGVTNQPEQVIGKLIALLHEIVPGARRMAILLNETNPAHPAIWNAAERACSALNVAAVRMVANSPPQIDDAVEQVVQQRVQAAVVIADPVFLSERAKLQALFQPTRLPVAYGLREHVDIGGLLSYGADAAASFRYAATYVDKIFKGAMPADLPVEQASKFELVINLKTAKTLALTVPPSLLQRADEVIQ